MGGCFAFKLRGGFLDVIGYDQLKPLGERVDGHVLVRLLTV